NPPRNTARSDCVSDVEPALVRDGLTAPNSPLTYTYPAPEDQSMTHRTRAQLVPIDVEALRIEVPALSVRRVNRAGVLAAPWPSDATNREPPPYPAPAGTTNKERDIAEASRVRRRTTANTH